MPADVRGRALSLGFVARATLLILLLWGSANLLWRGRDVLFVAFFAVIVAAFLSIFVSRLHKVGVPRALAAVLVLLSFLGLFAGLFWLAWPTLQQQIGLIQEQLPQAISRATTWIQAQFGALTGQFGQPGAQLLELLRRQFASRAGTLLGGVMPLLNTVVGTVTGVVVVIFAGLYLAADPHIYARGLTLLVPPPGREQAHEALVEVGTGLRRWMLGTAISMTIIGVLTGLGLWLLGIKAALALAVIAALLEFIPFFGPILSALPAIAIALVVSPAQALWVALLYLGIQQLESNVITPVVMKEAVELQPAVVILWASFMALLFGFLGLLLAVPILVAAKILIGALYVDDALGGEEEERRQAAHA